MAAPTWVQAGTGATDAGGAWSFIFDAILTVGNTIIIPVVQDGTTNGALTSFTFGGIANLAGTNNDATMITGPNADGSWPIGSPEAARQFLWIGRATSVDLSAGGANSTSEDLYCNMQEFTNVSAGTTLATVIENGTAGTAVNQAGTSATAADAGVTTLGFDRLAVNFLGINDDNAFAGFTGQSGGTWTTRASYAEASGTDAALYAIDAPMAAAGTIGGGTGSITASDAWGVVGFALIGTTSGETLLPSPTNFGAHAIF